VVANQVVEAEDADFEDGVVRTETQVHDRQDAHKLHITILFIYILFSYCYYYY